VTVGGFAPAIALRFPTARISVHGARDVGGENGHPDPESVVDPGPGAHSSSPQVPLAPSRPHDGNVQQDYRHDPTLQRAQRGDSLYVLDEPTTGLHPLDVDRLMVQLHGLVDAGNTVVVVEHELRVVADADWLMDIGPGAGEEGGRIVAAGTPRDVAASKHGKTAPYLRRLLEETSHGDA
jgi:hypothetical protein